VKFTPSDGRVRLTVARTDGEIEIAVSDTGIGISPDFLSHVFERFRQQDAGTTRRHGGLGLGLAIVRSLVELHGGSVDVKSEREGRGTTFTVRLPAPAGTMLPVTDTATRAAAARAASPSAVRLDGIRVLVVDDDPGARELFAAILETAGATVTAATSAEHALTLLRGASHDVILSDIEMPDLNGYGLIHEALTIAQGRGERLMAVAITAYSRPDDEARSLAAGFNRHVQKPIEPSTLIAVVASLCGADDRTRRRHDMRNHDAL
jgi:CheY-like chemotaxis protein